MWRFIPRPDLKLGVVEIQNKTTWMLADVTRKHGAKDQSMDLVSYKVPRITSGGGLSGWMTSGSS